MFQKDQSSVKVSVFLGFCRVSLPQHFPTITNLILYACLTDFRIRPAHNNSENKIYNFLWRCVYSPITTELRNLAKRLKF